MQLTGALEHNTPASLSRALAGLGLAILVAKPAGLVIGSSRLNRPDAGPAAGGVRNTAPLALLPVFTLKRGIGEVLNIAMVFYAAGRYVFLSTVTAAQNVDPALISVARTMGFSRIGQFRIVTLPASVATIVTGIRMAAALSILVLIAAEMVAAKVGSWLFGQRSAVQSPDSRDVCRHPDAVTTRCRGEYDPAGVRTQAFRLEARLTEGTPTRLRRGPPRA
jgi:ABC-type nitrate/sulfonate/bicarbonate transport system permease component